MRTRSQGSPNSAVESHRLLETGEMARPSQPNRSERQPRENDLASEEAPLAAWRETGPPWTIVWDMSRHTYPQRGDIGNVLAELFRSTPKLTKRRHDKRAPDVVPTGMEALYLSRRLKVNPMKDKLQWGGIPRAVFRKTNDKGGCLKTRTNRVLKSIGKNCPILLRFFGPLDENDLRWRTTRLWRDGEDLSPVDILLFHILCFLVETAEDSYNEWNTDSRNAYRAEYPEAGIMSHINWRVFHRDCVAIKPIFFMPSSNMKPSDFDPNAWPTKLVERPTGVSAASFPSWYGEEPAANIADDGQATSRSKRRREDSSPPETSERRKPMRQNNPEELSTSSESLMDWEPAAVESSSTRSGGLRATSSKGKERATDPPEIGRRQRRRRIQSPVNATVGQRDPQSSDLPIPTMEPQVDHGLTGHQGIAGRPLNYSVSGGPSRLDSISQSRQTAGYEAASGTILPGGHVLPMPLVSQPGMVLNQASRYHYNSAPHANVMRNPQQQPLNPWHNPSYGINQLAPIGRTDGERTIQGIRTLFEPTPGPTRNPS